MAIYMMREPFTPGANTIFYFPFQNDADDHSGNGYSLDVSGTQETIGRTFNTSVNLNKASEGTKFFSTWINIQNRGSGYSSSADGAVLGPGGIDGYMCYKVYSYWSGETDTITYNYDSSGSYTTVKYQVNSTIGVWIHVCWYYDSSVGSVCFVNGEKHTISTQQPYTGWTPGMTNLFQNKGTTKAIITLSDAIAESIVWTDQQVTDYFNATKSIYGLS